MLSNLASQSPVLLVCLVACFVILARWKQGSRGLVWALLGFGLALVLSIVVPIAQTSLQRWAIESGGSMASRASIMTGASLVWAAMRAISYICLLVAIFAGRPAIQNTSI